MLHAQISKQLTQQEVFDLPTCTARLKAVGLDFGDGGGVSRLAVSQYALDRKRVYDAMGSGVRSQGLALGGVITQGLKQADLFKVAFDVRSGAVRIAPILHPLEVPVRAMILPLRDATASSKIRDAVRQHLVPVVPQGGVWLQDDKLYHATLYHASSHQKPIKAGAEVIAEEARSIRGVTGQTCPIQAVLDRVVVTPGGVVVACWQVLPAGGEPALLRSALGAALPNAPPREAQMVKEPAMLHTTIARLLQPPVPDGGGAPAALDSGAVVGAVDRLSLALCGLMAPFQEVWFIEEQDLLALALNGRYVRHLAPLTCPGQSVSERGDEELQLALEGEVVDTTQGGSADAAAAGAGGGGGGGGAGGVEAAASGAGAGSAAAAA